MSRCASSTTLALMLLACGASRGAPPAVDRPNILFLLTDDQRWDAMGCAGNPIIETPNLDRLAREGVRFTNMFCTTSICAVSRASFLTGEYASRHGVRDFATPLSADAFAETFPALLRKNGYFTGFVGKWGLGGRLPKKAFDVFDGFPGQGKYFDANGGEHLTTRLGRKAVAFVRNVPADRPFLLCFYTKAPHVQDTDPRQFIPDPRFKPLYADVTIPSPPAATPEDFAALPPFLQTSEGRTRWKRRFATPAMYQSMVKDYYRLVTGLDAALGNVLAAIAERGLADRTVVICSSDNGFFLGEHGLAGKWFMYEESIRLPLIIRDPRAASEDRGRTVDAMTLNIDVAPTILDLAGVPAPKRMQGASLVPWLSGKSPTWRDEWFYAHHFGYAGRIPPSEGVRTQRWKYVRYLDSDPLVEQLFDVKEDPHEQHDLAADPAHRDTLERLRAKWRAWQKKVK
jgi:arylsulfatase A-like enzyme